MAKSHSDIGLIGLAVMGQNLALNIADHGFRISVYNRTTEKTEKFVAENPNTPGGLVGAKTLEEFVASIAQPRKIIILVQAGKGTDAVIDSLVPLLDQNDIVIDGGNALWTDTIRRERTLREKGLRFIGSGVSGGEEGARFGKSLFGSSACSGNLDMDEARRLVDKDGVSLADALRAVGVDLERVKDSGRELANAAAYLELHIEQGPVLESMGTFKADTLNVGALGKNQPLAQKIFDRAGYK